MSAVRRIERKVPRFRGLCIDTETGEYWEAEIQRRIEDVDDGRVATIPADEVFARLEQRFGGK